MSEKRKMREQPDSDLGSLCQQSEKLKKSESERKRVENIERRHQDSLVSMVEVAAYLSTENTGNNLCRSAVELGRTKLDLDRLGIWLCQDTPLKVIGTFGTDEAGQTRDERNSLLSVSEDSGMGMVLTGKSCVELKREPLLDDRASLHGTGWHILVPLEGKEGSVFGVLSVDFLLTGRRPDDYIVQIVRLYGLLVGHMLQAVQSEESLKKTLDDLQETLDGAVFALSYLAEKKDPYTAGHQHRVAKLACAIAEEMEFSADQVKSIRVAGILHDIGKIYVPAEILAKPGKLNEAEFAIIKCHSQMGYDIIKVIKFPWPIAQFIFQHHERCNGSGYPQGLSDGQILLEAKILAVADVVEAMSSHRPYRPALGVDQALKEISKNRGLLYEPIVVDACLNLFQKKQFTFA